MKMISPAVIALAVVLSSGGGLYPSDAQAQPSIQIGPGGIRVDDGRGRRGGGQCEELRLACENKDRLGEQGEGNCRRYRQLCQQQSRREVCEELRAACLNKDRLGEQGEGNCRRSGKPAASYGQSSGSPFSLSKSRPCDESFAHRPYRCA